MFRSFGLVLFLLVGLALLCSRAGIASKNGALQGYTGAPAENGASCTACHSGTANTGPGSLQILVASLLACFDETLALPLQQGGTFKGDNTPVVNDVQAVCGITVCHLSFVNVWSRGYTRPEPSIRSSATKRP